MGGKERQRGTEKVRENNKIERGWRETERQTCRERERERERERGS